MSDTRSRGSIKLPSDFRFGHVQPDHKVAAPPAPPPPLGPLAAFVGDWVGNGFNTIFRPNNTATPTPLPNPLPPGDNILEPQSGVFILVSDAALRDHAPSEEKLTSLTAELWPRSVRSN